MRNKLLEVVRYLNNAQGVGAYLDEEGLLVIPVHGEEPYRVEVGRVSGGLAEELYVRYFPWGELRGVENIRAQSLLQGVFFVGANNRLLTAETLRWDQDTRTWYDQDKVPLVSFHDSDLWEGSYWDEVNGEDMWEEIRKIGLIRIGDDTVVDPGTTSLNKPLPVVERSYLDDLVEDGFRDEPGWDEPYPDQSAYDFDHPEQLHEF